MNFRKGVGKYLTSVGAVRRILFTWMFSKNGTWPPQCVAKSLHEEAVMDFSSYGFNGGDNLTRTAGTNVYTRLGLGGVKLSAIPHPGRTLLVVENSAPLPGPGMSRYAVPSSTMRKA